ESSSFRSLRRKQRLHSLRFRAMAKDAAIPRSSTSVIALPTPWPRTTAGRSCSRATISTRPTSAPRVTPAERTKRGEGIVIVIFSSAFGFTGLPVRLGGRYPDFAPQAEGGVSPKSPGEVTFSSRWVAMTCIPAPLYADRKDLGLKPSGGDVLKPRKRSSVIVSDAQ